MYSSAVVVVVVVVVVSVSVTHAILLPYRMHSSM